MVRSCGTVLSSYNNTCQVRTQVEADPMFDQIERSTTAAQVAEQIREAALDGRLKSGDRLPPEHELARRFGVSRVVIREALSQLRGAGLIASGRRGRSGGPVIAGFPTGRMAELLADHLSLQAVSIPALVEFRVLVEAGAARWAAQRRSRSQLEGMGRTVAAMEQPDVPWEAYHDLDVAFHVAVTEASGNPCAAVVMWAIREAMRRAMIEGFGRAEQREDLRREMVRQHRGIYEAIAGGREGAADDLVRRHILDFYGKLFEEVARGIPPGATDARPGR